MVHGVHELRQRTQSAAARHMRVTRAWSHQRCHGREKYSDGVGHDDVADLTRPPLGHCYAMVHSRTGPLLAWSTSEGAEKYVEPRTACRKKYT